MVEIEKDYVFEGRDGEASLLDLFEGRRQLVLYHFMFAPGANGWPDAGCDGRSASSSATATASFAPTSRPDAASRRSAACGRSST